MSGSNYGAVYKELFGTSSPVSGTAPTSATDGQPMDGLASVALVASAGYGALLEGNGTLAAYVLDPVLVDTPGAAVVNGTPVLKLAFDAQGINFTVADVVYGATSFAHGTVSAQSDLGTTGILALSPATGTFVDNEPLAVPQATANGALSTNFFLAYDGGSHLFIVSEVVTGATSTAHGVVVAIVGDATTGVLEISTVSGNFQNNENLTGSVLGAAVADLTQYKTLSYDAQTVNFVAASVVYGLTSGATGTIQTDTDGGTTGVLNLKLITGTFVDNELIGVVYATADGALYQQVTYDGGTGHAFTLGQTVIGATTGASGTITVDSGTVLTVTGTGSLLFVDDENINSVSVARWARCPSLDKALTAGARDCLAATVPLTTPRKGRIKWVPMGVDFDTGSGGVTVFQLGQTYNALRDAGAA